MDANCLKTIAAHWVALGTGELVEDGWLEISQGRIQRIEKRLGRKANIDYGDAIILPGLVNAHTHLDLTGARGLTSPCLPFPDWLRRVVAYRHSCSEEQINANITAGIEQSLSAGTTLVGDISAGGCSWELIQSRKLKAVVFHELIGLSAQRAESALVSSERWLSTHAAIPGLRPGLSPHAPYSFRFDYLEKLPRFQVPIAIHVAESIDELELIMDHEGDFVHFLEEVGAWDPTGLPNLDAKVHPLHDTKRLLMIHGNYLPGSASVPSNATMVYCPRTHSAFDHPPHPFREWLKNGIRVAIGTDSLASNPDLSVLSEARFVATVHPDFDPSNLLKMITQNGAYALGFEAECGSIAERMVADLCVIGVPSNAADPIRSVFFGNGPLIAVYCDGIRLQLE